MDSDDHRADTALATLKKLRAGVEAIPSISIACPNYPAEHQVTQAESLINVFCRHSLRALYYSDNFLTHMKRLAAFPLRTPGMGETVGVPVQDEIFFDFDAFVFGVDSLFSGSILKRSRALDRHVVPVFRDMAERAKRDFVDPYLKVVRNEVVHLNAYGSNLGSFARLTNRGNNWGVHVLTTFRTADGAELDLIALFFRIYDQTTIFTWQILGIFLLHMFLSYGKPTRDVGYVSDGAEVRLSNFPIPDIKA